jgi:hypothetical protein
MAYVSMEDIYQMSSTDVGVISHNGPQQIRATAAATSQELEEQSSIAIQLSMHIALPMLTLCMPPHYSSPHPWESNSSSRKCLIQISDLRFILCPLALSAVGC